MLLATYSLVLWASIAFSWEEAFPAVSESKVENFGAEMASDSGLGLVFSETYSGDALRNYLQNKVDSAANDQPLLSEPQQLAAITESLRGWIVSRQWEDEDFVLAYGKNAEGSLIVAAWSKSNNEISLQELVRVYLDEQLAKVTTVEEHDQWQSERRYLQGNLYGIENSAAPVKFIASSSSAPSLSPPTASQQIVSKRPMILEFGHTRVAAKNSEILKGSADMDFSELN